MRNFHMTAEERAQYDSHPYQREKDGEVSWWEEYVVQEKNRYGCTPRRYESTSRWVEYECGNGCGNRFCLKVPPSQVRSCRQGKYEKMQCKRGRSGAGAGDAGDGMGRTGSGSQTRLELLGEKRGALEVVGHERGKGWKVKCDCGRERFILNSTALAGGAYKTCGKCTEEERRSPVRSMAPQSSLAPLRDDFVVINPEDRTGDAACATAHPRITFSMPDNDACCPLCAALARIELLEGDLQSQFEMRR